MHAHAMRAPADPARAASSPVAASTAALLTLQRAAGNAAVATMLDGDPPRALAVQRTIVLGIGTLPGFANTKDYKQLPDQAKAGYAAMKDDRQHTYAFADRPALLAFLTGIGTARIDTPKLVQEYAATVQGARPEIHLIERLRDYRSVEEERAATLAAKKPGDKTKPDLAPMPYGASGHSMYVASTEPHVRNWGELVRVQVAHAAALASTNPTPVRHDRMKAIADEAAKLAVLLDHEDVVASYERGADAAATPLPQTEQLHELLAALGAEATRRNALYMARPPRPSIPRFGSLRESMGTWADLLVDKYGAMPEGSAAAGSRTYLPWQENFLRHRAWGYASAENLYIRGHLLNDHIGGPARSYNLVPLTGISTTTPNANKMHEAGIEGTAKMLIREMFERRDAPSDPLDSQLQDPHSIETVRYRVDVSGWGQSRDGTAVVRAAQHDADFLLSLMKPPSGVGTVTVGQFAAYVRSQPFAHMWGPIYAAMKAVATPGADLSAARAVDVILRMKLNADLWEYEDEHIPQGLLCQVTVSPLNAPEKVFAKHPVANTLPDDVVRMRYV